MAVFSNIQNVNPLLFEAKPTIQLFGEFLTTNLK